LTDANELTFISFPIEKTEDTGEVNPVDHTPDIVVYGKATDGSLDGDLQVVDPEWSAKALQEWMETGGNLRVQHQAQRDPAGVGLAVDGHYVKGLVVEPSAKHLVRTKALRDFSIGISHPKIDRDPTGKAMNGVITGHPDGRTKVCEVSLVDRGSNHNSRFQLVKAAGDGTPQYVGKMLGTSVGDLAGQSVTIDLPADVSVAFSPADLAKLLAHRAEAERRQAEAETAKDWAQWDAAHGGPGGSTASSSAKPPAAGPGTTAKKPGTGNSAADASAAWQHARQTLQEEHDGKKPDAADAENAHLIHEAHLAHEQHEAAGAKKALTGGEKDAFTAQVKKDSVQDLGSAVHRLSEWAGSGSHPAGTGHADLKWMYDTISAELKSRDPSSEAGGNFPAAKAAGAAPADVLAKCKALTDILASVRDRTGGGKGDDTAKAARKAQKKAAKQARKAAAMTGADEADGEPCPTCKGKGKIREGHMECPDCHGTGKKAPAAAKDAEPAEVKAGKRSCPKCGKNHHSDSPAKFCDACGTKLPGGAKEEGPDVTKKGGQDQEPPGDDDEDDEDMGSDLDGDDEDDDDQEDDGGGDDDGKDGGASKSSRPAPGDGVTGERTQPVPPHREPDGPAIEALEHDAGLPTVPDGDLPKAAWLRLKGLGVPHDAGALHDLLCPAYDPAIAAKCHPHQPLTAIDTAAWRDQAMTAAASAPLDVAGKMAELWQHAETIKATGPVALAEVSEALHKAFADANPGPGTFPTPAELDPRRFRRPYIGAGHAASSPQASGPSTAALPPSGGITATGYTRGYITAGHAGDSPQNKAADGDAPPAPGASNGSRLFYRNTARDNARAAMQAMHDHIAQTFPDLCPMKDDPHASPAPRPGPLPVPAGSAKAGTASSGADPGIAGARTVTKAAGAAAPDLVKAAVGEATAPLAALLADAMDLIRGQDVALKSQAKALKKQARTLDAIAAQPDPVTPYRGAPLEQPGIAKSHAPAGPSGMAASAERSQQLMYGELYRTWRESPDPTERIAAEQAMARMRGLPSGTL
jgi:hypothetical protein